MKKILKRFLPPPVNAFNREVANILEQINQNRAEVTNVSEQANLNRSDILNVLERVQQNKSQSDDMYRRMDELTKENQQLLLLVKEQQKQLEYCFKSSEEAIWAAVFNNTITESSWLLDKTFSPGRWAVGYPYLYVIYRTLNETRPKCILEMGLGQSTKMIGQYAAAFADVEHIVIEQDYEWTEFFKQSNHNLINTKIIHVPVTEIEFQGDDKVLVYKDLPKILKNKYFDFISVDGSARSRSGKYRRMDVLGLIPQNLEDSFCILMDDMNEKTCCNAYNQVLLNLNKHNIEYVDGTYFGKKTLNVIVSPDNQYLTTL